MSRAEKRGGWGEWGDGGCKASCNGGGDGGSAKDWSRRYWGGDFSYGWYGNGEGLFGDDGVESVDGIGAVVDLPSGTVRVQEGVGSSDDVPAAGFDLSVTVTGEGVLDFVAVGVLRVGVVGFGDDGSGYGSDG